MGFLALELLIQNEENIIFLNDFIEILRRCYNIDINEELILFLNLFQIANKGEISAKKFYFFFHYLINMRVSN